MSADVHLSGGRGTPKLNRTFSGGDYEGYYGVDESWDGWDGKWEDAQYGGYESGPMGYYDGGEWTEGGAWDTIDVDMYSMIFALDAHLEPQDLYDGFELDDKSLVFFLEADDINEQTPQAWKSRPLKIHPEPATRKASGPASSSGGPGSTRDAATPNAGSNADGDLGTPGGSPRGPQRSPQGSPIGSPRVPSAGALQTTPMPSKAAEPEASMASPKSGGGNATPGGPAASPTIRISNTQLEHLKQKMQALKQKRGSGTPTAAPEQETMEGRTTTHRVPTSNCPGAHGLKLFHTPDHGWWCSKCEQEHPQGSSFYGCRDCDYDECESCACATSLLTARPATAAPPAAPVQKEQPPAAEGPVSSASASASVSPGVDDHSDEGSSSSPAPRPAAEKKRRRRRRSGSGEKTSSRPKEEKSRQRRRAKEADARSKDEKSLRKRAKASVASGEAKASKTTTPRSKTATAQAPAKTKATSRAQDESVDDGGSGDYSPEESASPADRRHSAGAPAQRTRKVTRESRLKARVESAAPAARKSSTGGEREEKPQRQVATAKKRRSPERRKPSSRRVSSRVGEESSSVDAPSASEEDEEEDQSPPKRLKKAAKAANRDLSDSEPLTQQRPPRGSQSAASGVSLTRATSKSARHMSDSAARGAASAVAAKTARDAAREAARNVGAVDEASSRGSRSARGMEAPKPAPEVLARGRGHSSVSGQGDSNDLLRRVLQSNRKAPVPGGNLFRGIAGSAGLLKDHAADGEGGLAAKDRGSSGGDRSAMLKPSLGGSAAPSSGGGSASAPNRLRKMGLADLTRTALEQKSRRV